MVDDNSGTVATQKGKVPRLARTVTRVNNILLATLLVFVARFFLIPAHFSPLRFDKAMCALETPEIVVYKARRYFHRWNGNYINKIITNFERGSLRVGRTMVPYDGHNEKKKESNLYVPVPSWNINVHTVVSSMIFLPSLLRMWLFVVCVRAGLKTDQHGRNSEIDFGVGIYAAVVAVAVCVYIPFTKSAARTTDTSYWYSVRILPWHSRRVSSR